MVMFGEEGDGDEREYMSGDEGANKGSPTSCQD